MKKGTKVKIVGDHPHSGEIAEFVDFRETILGFRPVVKCANGEEYFIMNPKHWQRVL